MEEMLEALVGKEIEELDVLASGAVKVTFTDGSFMVVTGRLTTSEELGIEVGEDEPEEEPKKKGKDKDEAAEDDDDEAAEDDENLDKVADILDVDTDEVEDAIDEAKKKVLTKVVKALGLDPEDYDDADEMRDAIKEDLDIEVWED